MHDDRSNINVHDLTLMATTIARSLYALATVDDVKDATAMKHAVASATHLVANSELIETLVNCSVISWNCPLTKEYIPWMIDIAKGKQKGSIDLSADRRLKYLSRINNRYIAVPQVQVLRELLAEVTTSPEQVGVSCDVASLSIEDGATINPNYDLCKINITGYECVNRRYVNTCVLQVFAALGVCVLIGCFSFVSFDCFFFIGIAHRCIQPNAWFHWAYQINEENAWSAASNAVNYRIYVPGTSLPAIQVYRRADVAMEGYMLIVGVVFSVVGVVVARWLLKNNDQYGLITKGVL